MNRFFFLGVERRKAFLTVAVVLPVVVVIIVLFTVALILYWGSLVDDTQ
jgi:hypothetical protein